MDELTQLKRRKAELDRRARLERAEAALEADHLRQQIAAQERAPVPNPRVLHMMRASLVRALARAAGRSDLLPTIATISRWGRR